MIQQFSAEHACYPTCMSGVSGVSFFLGAVISGHAYKPHPPQPCVLFAFPPLCVHNESVNSLYQGSIVLMGSREMTI